MGIGKKYVMRKIPIKTTEEKFYRQFLEVFKSIPPFSKLRAKELDVLGEILYQNNKYKNIPKGERSIVVFSKEVRTQMRDRLLMTVDIFNNNLSGLRKYKIISNNNKLMKFLELLYFDGEFNLEFNFKI